MRKFVTTLLVIPALLMASAQTENDRRFDDLYHFIVRITFLGIMFCSTANGSSSMAILLRKYLPISMRRNSPMRSGRLSMCRQTGR